MNKIKNNLLKELLKERKTSDQIIVLLGAKDIRINDREWRSFVRQFNDNYAKSGLYIASNSQGYILTTKKTEIKKSAINKLKTGVAMIKNSKLTLKELEDANQLRLLDDDEIKLYNIVKAFN